MTSRLRSNYSEFLTKPLAIPSDDIAFDRVRGEAAQNAKLGDLSELSLTKSGDLIPVSGDWSPFNTNYASYGSNPSGSIYRLNITGIDPRKYFVAGDRIRLNQGSGVVSAYVVYVDDGEIYITKTGASPTVTSSAFLQFDIAKNANPEGFEHSIFYAPSTIIDQDSNTISITWDKKSVEIVVDGRVVFCYLDFMTFDYPSGDFSFSFDLPIYGLRGSSPSAIVGYQTNTILIGGGTSALSPHINIRVDYYDANQITMTVKPVSGGTFNSGILAFTGMIVFPL